MTANDIKDEVDAYLNIINLLQHRCERLNETANILFGK
jgi:hypothetical protein